MLVYPQLPTGAAAQFPVQAHSQMRTLVNTAADGTVFKLADLGAAKVEWQLKYTALSDAELATFLQFFAAAEGTLNNFTFVDPTANLLAWSGDLSNAVWDAAPFLSSIAAIADPAGGNTAWQVTNSGTAVQDLTQTLTAPGGYLYCFSLYAKSANPATITLLLGSNRYNQNLNSNWQRFTCTGTSDPAASSVTFGVELGAGAVVAVYGLQVEPQDILPSTKRAPPAGATRTRDWATTRSHLRLPT